MLFTPNHKPIISTIPNNFGVEPVYNNTKMNYSDILAISLFFTAFLAQFLKRGKRKTH